MNRRDWIISCAVLMLNACASQPNRLGQIEKGTEAGSFALNARVSIRHEGRADVLHLDWAHAPSEDSLVFSSPLGQILAQVERTPRGAWWRGANGQYREADDIQTLLAQLTDWTAPLDSLADWVQGRPSPNAHIIESDALQRATHYADGGWFVRVFSYENDRVDARPKAIEVARGDLAIRLAIETWQ